MINSTFALSKLFLTSKNEGMLPVVNAFILYIVTVGGSA